VAPVFCAKAAGEGSLFSDWGIFPTAFDGAIAVQSLAEQGFDGDLADRAK
jgi:hypothetical protein